MLRRVLSALMLMVGAFPAFAGEVPLMNYHEIPPFVTGPDSGLTNDLAAYLTRKSGGKYTFVVQNMPRKRLDAALAEGKPVVVPWAVPVFFADEGQTKYKWSPVVLPDANAVVSPKGKPFEYAGPESLAGKVLGGVAGYRYGPIDTLVSAGKVQREDVASEVMNLRKAAQGRIDATIMAEAAVRYMIKAEKLEDHIHLSATPQSRYERRLFVSNGDEELGRFVTSTVEAMTADPEWKAIADKYLR